MLQNTVYLDGDKLKFLRVIKNETHRSLSEKSGVSTGTLWNLEKRGRNERFHPNTLNKLARALEVEPTELISGE
jgi:transcriptional regulator with XRE-family HTH domain